MWDAPTLLIVLATFLLAGTVKGIIGLGLPTVVLALLTAMLGLREAMVLMLAPSLVTNVWQALVGGELIRVLARLWGFLIVGFACIWLTVTLLGRSDSALLPALLGLTLIAYAGVGLAARPLPAPGHHERWLSPLVSATTGVLTGMTGSFVVPAVGYLQTLGLRRDTLVQAMGVWFTVATLGLAVSLQGQRLLPPDQAALSAIGILPALAGMALGQRVRHSLSEARFRQVLFAALGLLGAYIVWRSVP